MSEIREITSALLSEGYEPHAPSTGMIDAATADGSVCAEATCYECGRKGMDYYPFTKRNSYRAFVVCPGCGFTTEF